MKKLIDDEELTDEKIKPTKTENAKKSKEQNDMSDISEEEIEKSAIAKTKHQKVKKSQDEMSDDSDEEVSESEEFDDWKEEILPKQGKLNKTNKTSSSIKELEIEAKDEKKVQIVPLSSSQLLANLALYKPSAQESKQTLLECCKLESAADVLKIIPDLNQQQCHIILTQFYTELPLLTTTYKLFEDQFRSVLKVNWYNLDRSILGMVFQYADLSSKLKMKTISRYFRFVAAKPIIWKHLHYILNYLDQKVY